jgi:hypothetical protein
MSLFSYDRNVVSALDLNAFSNTIKSTIISSIPDEKLSGNGLGFSLMEIADVEDDLEAGSIADIPDLILSWKAKLMQLGTTYCQVATWDGRTILFVWDLSTVSNINENPHLESYGDLLATITLTHPDGKEVLEYTVSVEV